MKFVLCFVVLAMVIASVLSDAGQSACRDASELKQTYPHHFDPSKYWYCETEGVPATEMDCPKGEAYMHYLKECIPWASWIWQKPHDPPTLA